MQEITSFLSNCIVSREVKDMEYKGDLKVIVTNNGQVSINIFENEHLSISRAGHLHIGKIDGEESELIETVKYWFGLDNQQLNESIYQFETSKPPSIGSFRKYKICSVNEKEQTILFKECN